MLYQFSIENTRINLTYLMVFKCFTVHFCFLIVLEEPNVPPYPDVEIQPLVARGYSPKGWYDGHNTKLLHRIWKMRIYIQLAPVAAPAKFYTQSVGELIWTQSFVLRGFKCCTMLNKHFLMPVPLKHKPLIPNKVFN